MSETKKYPINHEWDEYYQLLELIRQAGIANMLIVAPSLAEYANISEDLAINILCSWIENYNELNEQFQWQ